MLETVRLALIVGAGDGLGPSLARRLAAAGLGVALAARYSVKGTMDEEARRISFPQNARLATA